MPVQQSVQEQQGQVVSAMDLDQLREWLIEVAEGTDVLLEVDTEETFFPLLTLYRQLELSVRLRIDSAMVNLLLEVIKEKQSIIELLENVLLMAQLLCIRAVRPILEAFVASERFATLDESHQYRVLQTLIALKSNLAPSFWYRVLRLQPDKFAGVVFDGLALVSPTHAVDFLSRASGTSGAVKQIALGLPGFVDDLESADSDRIRALIESRIPEMAPSVASAVTDFFTSEGTPIPVLNLDVHIQPEHSHRTFKVSADAFPMLAQLGDAVNQILNLKLQNPARLFSRLAHQ
jgi:hypothetical protein